MIILSASAAYIKSPQIVQCFLIGTSNNFDEVKENFYISKDTPQELRDSILHVLNCADERVCEFWETKKRSGNPVIIFCYSKSLLSEYSKNNLLLTYKTPLRSFIIFSNDVIDLDMLSHELFHTEFCARTGYFANSKLPVWFDEGLAMQVDYRDTYSETMYAKVRDSLQFDSRLSHITTPETFYAGNFFNHFVFARHEVYHWMRKAGKEGLLELIHRIHIGEEFNSAYQNIYLKEKYNGPVR